MPFFKDGIITFDKVQTVVRSKWFSKVKYLKIYDSGECLSILKGESELWGMPILKRFDKSMVKFFTCYKLGHTMRDCPKKSVNDYDQMRIVMRMLLY